jgi:glyoxylate reductase
MSKPKVYATHPMFESARKLIESHCEVEYWRGSNRPARATLLEKVVGKDALICLLTEKINDELLAAGPALRIVANVAVGFDNIDVPACTRHKVFASNTPGVLDETTADFAWTLLMAVARRVLEGDRLTRSGQWTGWDLDQLCGADIWGKTLGVVGFGRIGRAVARRAGGFNMRVIYTDAIRAPLEAERELRAEYVPMDRVFADRKSVV